MSKLSLEYFFHPTRLAIVALVVLVIGALMWREPQTVGTQMRQSTYGTDPFAARGLYEVVSKLGWKTTRRLHPFKDRLDTNKTYVILTPALPLHQSEQKVLLNAVRRGAKLMILAGVEEISDSLHLKIDHGPNLRISHALVPGDSTSTGRHDSINDTSEPDTNSRMSFNNFFDDFVSNTSNYVSLSEDEDSDSIKQFLHNASAELDSSSGNLIIGCSFGKGKVVAISDGNVVRNATLKQGTPAAGFIRALEWLSPPGSVVEFDEYHQGFGHYASTPRAIKQALFQTTWGRAASQCIVAALVLLVAAGATGRALPPRPLPTPQRRSPLEHVTALANAYAQINASKLGVQRLMRGLRRRHPISGITMNGQSGDSAYLNAISARYPALTDDTDLLKKYLDKDLDEESLVNAARAIARIEETLKL